MKSTVHSLSLCAFLAALAASGPSHAAILVSENFDTDGLGTRYLAVGAGSTASAFWQLGAAESTPLTGFQGANFWGGRNLDTTFGGTNQLPRTLTVPITAVDVSLFTDLQVSILVAANQGQWESEQPDFLRIVAVNADTDERQVLEEFLPRPENVNNGDLTATINSSTVLTTTFQPFTFNISSVALPGLEDLLIVIEAGSTSSVEYFGVDELVVSGTLIPEPATGSLLLLGALGLAAARRRRR
ncbi:MAG: PEP-CTERM sorting domain-containing protein [Verrucomicrobiota bacterium]